MAPGGEVGRVGKADLVEADEAERVKANALTASMYGFRLLYLEAGSGANAPVNPDLIRAARDVPGLTLMVGGGLRDGAAVSRAIEAGADWVVTGTLIEETADSTALVQALDDVLSGLSAQSSS
jgi:phosphoglycerol geranylgeranyltransferase